MRLLLQLGYNLNLPVRGLASRALLLTSAFSLLLIFIHFESDLTARMTSKPSKLNIKSFDDVLDQGVSTACAVTRKIGGVCERGEINQQVLIVCVSHLFIVRM